MALQNDLFTNCFIPFPPMKKAMTVTVFENYTELSVQAASLIADALKADPSLTLCMASGHTPALTCELLVKKIREENINYSGLRFIGLDEWVGLRPDNPGSCHYFFQTKLIGPLQLNPSQYFLFDALATDLTAESQKMDAVIAEKGIDLMVVGIGMNGHIGFNEPGISFDLPCHVTELEEMTKQVGQKYFVGETTLGKGITIGLKHFMSASSVLLMANGAKKAEVIQKALKGPVSEQFPGSIIQLHKNALVLLDDEAAMKSS